jgi:hypothetical protein
MSWISGSGSANPNPFRQVDDARLRHRQTQRRGQPGSDRLRDQRLGSLPRAPELDDVLPAIRVHDSG